MHSPNFRIPKFFNILKIAIGLVSMVATITPATAQIYRLNTDEMTLFKRIAANAEQQRDTLRLDPTLCIVARKRAADMASRHYFSHTNPDGQGANYLVRRAGYMLPSYYDRSRSGNNLESIGMSTGTPQEMVSLWLHSSGHRVHVLGEFDFYRQQTSVGVGVFRSPEAPHYKYFVFLSAPPNASLTPRAMTLKSPTGATLASTRPLANALAPFIGTTTR
jgi:Cysteine-rich secretory protein family